MKSQGILKTILSGNPAYNCRHEIGSDAVRMGVITFGKDVNTEPKIKLGSRADANSLLLAVAQLAYNMKPTGGPNIVGAIDAAIEMFANNTRVGGVDVPKVALLLTEDPPTNIPVEYWDKAKKAGKYVLPLIILSLLAATLFVC